MNNVVQYARHLTWDICMGKVASALCATYSGDIDGGSVIPDKSYVLKPLK